ncbi:MAG: hypothetical protein CMQ34_14835 [Gammaproteobacteria bacterium]|mgnify:CR=1 FL=1|nr:hypothetical protein [Gammaproteobacteria bacterium]|tara:strand:+ start:1489 stop:2061 length:573 start_codon:yes stop_codon:yes gene_type:complete
MPRPGPPAQSGTSLLELFAALAIIATLATLALPVFTLLEREESARVLRQFLSLVASARSAAIRLGHPVTLCPVDERNRCIRDWRTGVMLFVDADEDRQRGNNEALLSVVHWHDLQGSLHWRAFGNRRYLLVDPFGGLTGQNGNLTWCPSAAGSAPAHQLVLNGSGRFRFARDSDGDGLREDSRGQPLRCL